MTYAACALFAASVAVLLYVLRRVRSYERRLSQMEMHVVRSVMEESPRMVESVLHAQKTLYGSMSAADAMREARRLHGLEP